MIRFRAPLSSIILMCISIAPFQAQTGDWRREVLGSQTQPVELRNLGGVYVARAFDGYYSFDEGARAWSFLGKATEDLQPLQYVRLQPDGAVVTSQGLSSRTIDVRTGELGEMFQEYAIGMVGDTLIGALYERYNQAQRLTTVIAKWMSLDATNVVWEDSATVSMDLHGSSSCMVSDTAMLLIKGNYALRFPLFGSATASSLPDTVWQTENYVWLDHTRSHVVIRGKHSWMYSIDNGMWWTNHFVDSISAARRVIPTMDADVLLVQVDSALFAYHLSTGDRDTLIGPSEYTTYMSFAHGPLGTIAATLSGIMLFASDGSRTDVSAGLPEVSAKDLMAASNGLLASLFGATIQVREGGEWAEVGLDYDKLHRHGWNSTITFRGSRSTKDFWFTKESFVYHVVNDQHLPLENLLLPDAGVWVPTHQNYVTCITSLNDSRQVMWWGGSSPVRTLLDDLSLSYLVAFSDDVLVAFGSDRKIHRTLSGRVDQWEVRDTLPPQNNIYFHESEVKGRHALVRVGGLVAVTHDSGVTWTTHELPRVGRVAITAGGDLLFATFYGPETSGDLGVQLLRDNRWEEVARLPRSEFDGRSSDILAVAYDDIEQRLHVATQYWIRSVGLQIVGVAEDRDEWSAPYRVTGVYDLLGRYVGAIPEEITNAGAFIVVTPQGSQLRILP